jgi:hypothetical protein
MKSDTPDSYGLKQAADNMAIALNKKKSVKKKKKKETGLSSPAEPSGADFYPVTNSQEVNTLKVATGLLDINRNFNSSQNVTAPLQVGKSSNSITVL